jgi:carboxymethylenebutenolidase
VHVRCAGSKWGNVARVQPPLAARNWIVAKAGRARIGITGFCTGGGYALKALIGSTAYAAASIFLRRCASGNAARRADDRGNVRLRRKNNDARARKLRRTRYEHRTGRRSNDVRPLARAARAEHLYPEAGHAFFDDTRASYAASAAADAWTKTLAWFHRYLA